MFFKNAACVALAFLLFFGVSAAVARAQVNVGLEFGTATGLSTTDIRTIIARILNYFFGLLGIIAVALIMYAGFLWMTAGGNQERVAKAQRILRDAVIGLAIILSAYAIVAFLFQRVGGAIFGRPPSQQSGCAGLTCSADVHSEALGNGVIQYHYPEPNQKDVPRNTRIAITFRRPLALSTVFRAYDDKGTFTVADDKLCAPGQVPPACDLPVPADVPLDLNTDNFKIIANTALVTTSGGTFDQQFADRYGAALANAAGSPAQVTAKITPVNDAYDPMQTQTIVIRPVQPLGSPTQDVDNRVALRGSDAGIRVWAEGNQPGKPKLVDAFGRSDEDGAYFWIFTTNTTIDVTPPKIAALVPSARPDPSTSLLDRNQLLQVYFDEAVDPTSVSGTIGAVEGGGFTKMEVKAKCLADLPCDDKYKNDFTSVAGALVIGNRYRTVEFTPAEPCENVSENSCGDPVFCLPKNVELRLVAKAATVGAEAPLASVDDGVEDMVGNSLDGNKNGKTEGPSTSDSEFFSLNGNPKDVTGLKDSARVFYDVADTVDLTPPAISDTDPKSLKPENQDTVYAAGPSKFPPMNPIVVLWTKTISITSILTGAIEDRTATVVLQSKECRKLESGGGSVNCPANTEELPKPWYFIDSGLPENVAGEDLTRMKYIHRTFLSANDLGYTSGEEATQIPAYAPLLRAQVRDTKQNCFFPSVGAPAYACTGTSGSNTSCCNRNGRADATCPP